LIFNEGENMKRLKCLWENFGCRQIKADRDRWVLNRFVSKRSDTTSPDFLVGVILRFLRVPTFLSGRYCLILALSFLLAHFSFAQTPEWVYQYVKPKTDIPFAITVDSFGNTYTTGYLTSQDTTGGHISGICVIKLDTFGQGQWIYFNDTLARLAEGEDIVFKFNKVYVAGYAQFLGGNKDLIVLCVDTLGHTEWIHRDTGALEGNAVAVAPSRMIYTAGFIYTPNSLLDIIVKKLDSLGNEVWRYVYDGPAGSYDKATSIVVDRNENIYVGGYSTGSGTAEDFTVLKLDSAGHLVWEYRYDGPANYRDEPQAMALDTFGNIYIAGWSWGVDWDFCVVKIDSSGQEEWVYRYNGLANVGDLLYDLVVDDSGNVYIGGVSQDDTVDLFTVIKVDSIGQERWVYLSRGWGKGAGASAIVLDGLGNIYAGGGFTNYHINRSQVVVVKLNCAGESLWIYVYPHQPTPPWTDVSRDITADIYGNVYLACQINVSSWNDDIVVMKFASSQGVVKEVMKNEIRDKKEGATIFKGGIDFLPDEDCGLKVYDVSGRVLVDRILQSGKRESIRLLSGVYFIVIEGKNGKRVKKVIVL
jgi:hypothetical protein